MHVNSGLGQSIPSHGTTAAEDISTADDLNIARRIDELKELKRGWFNGKGEAPPHQGLDWLAARFDACYPHDLPLPYLYATPEGGVRAEWSLRTFEVSLDFDLARHSASWHSLNLMDDQEESRELAMDDAKNWEWLAQEVSRLAGKIA